MQFQALVIGYAFPISPFEGHVHSVFRNAANLRLRNGDLVTLTAPGGDDLPQGARLSAPEGFAFDALGLSANQKAACRGGVLRFAGSDFTIDLRAACTWRCNLESIAGDPDRLPVRQALSIVIEQLLGYNMHTPGGLVSYTLFGSRPSVDDRLVTRRAWLPVQELIAAARRCGAPPHPAVARLVGLGPGLTPSGDDFLVGFLAGLWSCAGANTARRGFVARLGKTVEQTASTRTNEISRAYLLHASRAQVARRLYDLAAAICLPFPVDHLLRTAQMAFASGHTSGMDTVSGLLAGLSAWSAARGMPS